MRFSDSLRKRGYCSPTPALFDADANLADALYAALEHVARSNGTDARNNFV